jgi:acetylornithine deacetylase/succinyl-diaminopimelate desuccinylase-like protein
MVLFSQRVAARHGGLASTGVIEAGPGSVNSVAERVKLSLDVRGRTDELVEAIEREIRDGFVEIARGKDVDGLGTKGLEVKEVEVEIAVDSVSPAVQFHEDCIRCVSESAAGLFQGDFDARTRKMVSGAGHDSVMTNRVCPTSMIFVPSKDGISHNPKEYTSPEDCATGAQVLLGAVLKYDRLRSANDS